MNLTNLDRAKKNDENGYRVELNSKKLYSSTPKDNFLIEIKECSVAFVTCFILCRRIQNGIRVES